MCRRIFKGSSKRNSGEKRIEEDEGSRIGRRGGEEKRRGGETREGREGNRVEMR